MKKTILRAKVVAYLLLAVLTIVCARFSFSLYQDDVESRTLPQITRAVVQISKLLPQLEQNEQAVRDVCNNLQDTRQSVLKGNEDVLGKQAQQVESVEDVISETLSWMNRVTMLRVGRRGHVIVISKDDYRILAHPDSDFVGETLRSLDNLDTSSIPDISTVTPENVPSDMHVFFPTSFFQENVSIDRFLAAADAGVYGTVVSYKDTYILCGVTIYEAIVFVLARCLITTLLFALTSWVMIRFIGFSLAWRKDERNGFFGKVIFYSASSVLFLFASIYFYQSLMDVTNDLSTMNAHAQVAVENLNTYQEYRTRLSDWLDSQYLEQCRLAKDLVKSKGKENLTRQDLAEYAKQLGVTYISVFNRDGRVELTNSPYDHFQLSDNKEDPSYAFRPLLEGREYVIQAPQKDELSGEEMQRVGVSLRNDQDLADGFVQIAVDTELRNRLLSPINVQTVLDNLVIGLPEYALALDKESKEVVATTTNLHDEKSNLKDLEIDLETIENNFTGSFDTGSFDIKGVTYYAGVSESKDLFMMPIVRSTDNKIGFFITLKMTAFCALSFILYLILAMVSYTRVLSVASHETVDEEVDASGAADATDDEDAEPSVFKKLKEMLEARKKSDFYIRWHKHSEIPLEERSPEMRAAHIIHLITLIFSAALLIYQAHLITMGIDKSRLQGFSYVLFGNWENGFNLFSISYCLFLACMLNVIAEFLNFVLYRIALVSDLKNETILLFLRNALKYVLAIIFLYLGLARFGIDTRALWASAGILSLMVGLGAKDLIADVVAGLFVIFEGTYSIGDWIKIGDWFGMVNEIGLRYTKFGIYSDTKIINNSSIRDLVSYAGEVAREVIKVPVSYDAKLADIEEVLERELPKIGESIEGLVCPPWYSGVASFEENRILLRVVILAKPAKRRSALREMQRQIKLLFDREHIVMPYQHIIVEEYEETQRLHELVSKDEAEPKA